MRLDEMIINANEDGKTYFCNGTDLEYSKEKGFTGIEPSDQVRKFTDIVLVNEWEEKHSRHLTVAEAEKELDCVIDVPDISKLFKSKSELPKPFHNVIIALEFGIESNYTGFRSGKGTWYVIDKDGKCEKCNPVFWIDPADLIKLLPKE